MKNDKYSDLINNFDEYIGKDNVSDITHCARVICFLFRKYE